jgi:hypothetical protein
MKKKITGRLAAAVLVAPLFLFAIQVASCGSNVPGDKNATSSPGNDGGKPPKPTVMVKCTDINNCPFTLTALVDSSPNQPRPKLWVYVTATQDVKAGTAFPLEVSFDLDSVNAYQKKSDNMR